MKNKVILYITIIFTLILFGCDNKPYEEAMENGKNALNNTEYENAVTHFETAIEAEPNDEDATNHLEQTKTFIKGLEAFELGNVEDATSSFEEVLDYKEASTLLIDNANKQLDEIQQLKSMHEDITKQLEQAKDLGEKESYTDALAILDKALDNNWDHPYLTSLKDDLISLQADLEDAEQKAKAEAKKKAAEEKQKAAEEALIEKVLGYWLANDETTACHITRDYMSCAIANSDGIFNDQITSITANTDNNTVTITSDNGTQSTFTASDDEYMEFYTGTYKRVSKQEANAIYGGYYELP